MLRTTEINLGRSNVLQLNYIMKKSVACPQVYISKIQRNPVQGRLYQLLSQKIKTKNLHRNFVAYPLLDFLFINQLRYFKIVFELLKNMFRSQISLY
jgi:hypothetical protein